MCVCVCLRVCMCLHVCVGVHTNTSSICQPYFATSFTGSPVDPIDFLDKNETPSSPLKSWCPCAGLYLTV